MFLDQDDFAFFRACAGFAARRHIVSVHAYVFMSNHVHLLVTPATGSSLPGMMQAIGRVYVRYFNKRHRRVGALWEARYRATFVDDATYLFTCMRYIELNPVRAGMVPAPAAYPWSSYHANALGRPDDLVVPHVIYRGLAGARGERLDAYRAMFDANIAPGDLDRIRKGQTLPKF